MRRISICKETRIIDTNAYILTFNKHTTPNSIKIGYINAKIETYIPNPLRCQKYGYHRDKRTRSPICAKCGKSNHSELECHSPFNCINYTEHPAYSQECETWKKEKGITEMKFTRNISFLKARKIVEQTQEKEQLSYTYVTRKEMRKRKIQNRNRKN